MILDFFDASVQSRDFLQLPREVVDAHNLKADEQFIFAYLYERYHITSYKDSEKNLYLTFTQEDAQNRFGLKAYHYNRIMQTLKRKGYIRIKRAGDGKYNCIYITYAPRSKKYIEIPRYLLKAKLALDNVLLYSILRDQSFLSNENGNVEPDGRIYVKMSYAEAASFLGCKDDDTAKRVLMDLVDAGYIEQGERIRSGNKMPKAYKWYVKVPADPATEKEKVHTNTSRKSVILDTEKTVVLDTEKTEVNYTNQIFNEFNSQSARARDGREIEKCKSADQQPTKTPTLVDRRKKIQEQVGYMTYSAEDREYVDAIIDLMLRALSSRKTGAMFGMSKDEVKSRIMTFNAAGMHHLLSKRSAIDASRNRDRYILSIILRDTMARIERKRGGAGAQTEYMQHADGAEQAAYMDYAIPLQQNGLPVLTHEEWVAAGRPSGPYRGYGESSSLTGDLCLLEELAYKKRLEDAS